MVVKNTSCNANRMEATSKLGMLPASLIISEVTEKNRDETMANVIPRTENFFVVDLVAVRELAGPLRLQSRPWPIPRISCNHALFGTACFIRYF